MNGGKLYSPYFYVTPNYANNSGCGTAIVTQATYTGINTLLEDKVTNIMLQEALDDTDFKQAMTTAGISDQPATYDKIPAGFWNDTDVLAALVTFLKANHNSLFDGIIAGQESAAISIKTGDKRYYRADVANMSADNTTSLKVTERNTFYHITGTITTLGAKSIEDAINSDDINMVVQVVVKKWNYVVNNVNM